MMRHGTHSGNTHITLMMPFFLLQVSSAQHANTAIPQLHDAVIYPAVERFCEARVANSKILGAVIKGIGLQAASRQSSPGSARLFEYPHTMAMVDQGSGSHETGQPRSDDRHAKWRGSGRLAHACRVGF